MKEKRKYFVAYALMRKNEIHNDVITSFTGLTEDTICDIEKQIASKFVGAMPEDICIFSITKLEG